MARARRAGRARRRDVAKMVEGGAVKAVGGA